MEVQFVQYVVLLFTCVSLVQLVKHWLSYLYFILFISFTFLFSEICKLPVPYRAGGLALCGLVCSVWMAVWVIWWVTPVSGTIWPQRRVEDRTGTSGGAMPHWSRWWSVIIIVFLLFLFLLCSPIYYQHNKHCVDFIYRKWIGRINRFPCWSLRRHNFFSSWCLTAHLIDDIRTFSTWITKGFHSNHAVNCK